MVLDHVVLNSQNYSNSTYSQFCSIGCRFEKCNFSNSKIDAFQIGSGRDVSEYIDCVFDGAKLEIGSSGIARFVRCSFENVKIYNWKAFLSELVDCRFSGRMEVAIFRGELLPMHRSHVSRSRNEFHGNDFSRMDLIDVAFRGGIDLSLQRLPSGPEYTYIKDAPTVLNMTRVRIAEWESKERRGMAERFLKGIQEDVDKGQRQLLLRMRDYRNIPSRSFDVIEEIFKIIKEVLSQLEK